MSGSDNPKYFIDGKWIESLSTSKKDSDNPANTVSSKTDSDVTLDPISEYQSWHMQMKILVREAEYAKETGQWQKSRDLLYKVDTMTREFADTRVSRP